jgi:Tfp pilus assembly pilus retraction ATPase PilT
MQGKISAAAQAKVMEATKLRFKDYSKFKTPEALVLYEQGLMPLDDILEFCAKAYGHELEHPHRLYVARETNELFEDSTYIPIYVDNMTKEVHVANIPEFRGNEVPELTNKYKVVIHWVSIVWYVMNHIDVYGYPPFLYELPIHDLLGFIIEEAIDMKVMDTTISSGDQQAFVYHQVNLRKVDSKRKITNHHVQDIVRLLCFRAGDALDPSNRSSKRISVQLNKHFRARIEITQSHHGFMITMRLLPNTYFSYNLDDIHLDEKTKVFLRRYCEDIRSPGARIIAGPTGSGKNTTIFSVIVEIKERRPLKIVSLEQPVELLLQGMEQIEAGTDELFAEYSRSLIRHNPDCVYFSEITDRTAMEFMKIANTGKTVFTTIHTNSAATIVSRLVDLTGLSVDRVMQDIHSLIWQRLDRDREWGMKPYNVCIYFSEALRRRCIGKDLGEVMKILWSEEDRWRTISAASIEQGMLET